MPTDAGFEPKVTIIGKHSCWHIEMIIWVASYPRSGNTYFLLLLKRHFQIDFHSAYDDNRSIHSGRPSADPSVTGPPAPPPVSQMADSDQIFFVKTHDLPQDDFPAIYLVRDGRDALVSYAHYIFAYEQPEGTRKSAPAFDDTLRSLILYNRSFGGWGQNVQSWTTRRAPTAIVRFEELVRLPDPLPLVRKSLERIGHVVEPPDVERPLLTFDDLREFAPRFFRSGKIGGWREEMPPDVQEIFWLQNRHIMERMGYER